MDAVPRAGGIEERAEFRRSKLFHKFADRLKRRGEFGPAEFRISLDFILRHFDLSVEGLNATGLGGLQALLPQAKEAISAIGLGQLAVVDEAKEFVAQTLVDLEAFRHLQRISGKGDEFGRGRWRVDE